MGLLYACSSIFRSYGFSNAYVNALLFAIRVLLVSVLFLFFIYLIPRIRHTIISDEFSSQSAVQYKWKYFLLFALCWFPFVIIRYPAAISPDTWQGVFQFRHNEMNGIQPTPYVVLVGVALSLLGNNVGICIISIIEYFVLSFTFGNLASYLRTVGVIPKVRLLLITIWITSPVTIGYIGVTIKDTLYAAGVVNLILILIEISNNKRISANIIFGTVGWGLLTCLSRPNGVYLMVIVAAFYMFSVACHKIPWKPVLAIIGTVIVGVLITQTLNYIYSVSKDSTNAKEALSIPFQQTARFVRDYEEDVTDEERIIIDNVLVYDDLADRYDPRISDPVKDRYTGNKAYLNDYFKVWINQLARHPDCYVMAFWEQNHYLFDPIASMKNISFIEGTTRFCELGNEFDCVSSWMYEDLFDEPEFFAPARKAVVSYCIALMNIPIPWFISNVGLVCIMTLFFWLIALFRKTKNSLIYYVPLIATIVITMAGPVVQGHPRYLFPIMYMAPVILIKGIIDSDPE